MSTTAEALSGQDILCVARRSWHGPWKANQQIMSLLARSNRVLYLGPPPPLREAVSEIRARESRGPTLERHGTLYIYEGPRLLARSRISPTFNWMSGRLRLAHVRHLARRLRFHRPILWVCDPRLGHAMGTFGEKLVIYHVIDNYVECLPRNAFRARRTLAKSEEAMLRRADIILAVSEVLHQRCLQFNPNSFLIPNGVDYALFQRALAEPTIPLDLRGIRKPLIGYVGVIEPKMNFRLLQQVADEHSEWSVIVVGPEELGGDRYQFEALLKRPNVFYLGFKPPQEVPNYIKCCDVCIMPDEERTDGDSLKLYEYLACGRPVVTLTDDASVRRFQPLIKIARDASGFGRAIRESLSEDPGLARARIAMARENSWGARVKSLSAVIHGELSSREAPPSSRLYVVGSKSALS